MQDKQWHMLETGLDLRIDEFGRLQIATNTPTGHVYQVLSLRPSTAYALKVWLGGQDWEAIERVAAKNDPTATSEFAAVRAHDAGTDEGLTDTRWSALCRDISDRRGLKNEWRLIDDDVKQDIRAAWSRILYASPASHAAESAPLLPSDTLHICTACWAGNHGGCSGGKCGCVHESASVAQLDAEDPAEPVEDVPPGYVKLNDVEKAIRAVWKEHYHSQAVWSKEEFLSKLMARLAPKPEPSQSAVIDTLRSEDFQRANACVECGTLVVHQELHAKWHAALEQENAALKARLERLSAPVSELWFQQWKPIINAIGEISVQEAMDAIERGL